MPRPLKFVILILLVLTLVPLALLSRARHSKSHKPRIHLISDMDNQPKFRTQSADPMFADGRAMRPVIEGTVAVGDLAADDHFYRGKVGTDWATTFPMPVTDMLMQRGRQRFDVFCSTCHGLSGYGDGLISVRANALAEKGNANWTPPTSLQSDTVRERPAGYIFNTITYGVRNMPAYGTQIPPGDRWAIVAYIRALERSQKASITDVPDTYRQILEAIPE